LQPTDGLPISHFFPVDQIYEHLTKNLFLLGATLGNEQGHSHKGIIGDTLAAVLAIQSPVFFEEPKKQGGANAFIPVDKRMVFDQEIEPLMIWLFKTCVAQIRNWVPRLEFTR